jgi:hypothetical protein
MPLAAAAGELEITGHIGPTFPFYEQAFEFEPGSPGGLRFPGITVTQEDIFRLDAHGAWPGPSASYRSPWLGLEARVDTADVGVASRGRATRSGRRPSPLPDLINELALSSGEADLHRIHPFSLNLRARSEGRTRFGGSAGLSYLPSFSFVIAQDVTLRIVEPLPVPIGTAHLAVAAEALPGEENQGRFGVNAGAFVQFGLNDRVASGRGAVFPLPEADALLGSCRSRGAAAARGDDRERHRLPAGARRVQPQLLPAHRGREPAVLARERIVA